MMFQNQKQSRNWLCLYSFIIVCLFTTSCISTKKTTYFNDITDSVTKAPLTIRNTPLFEDPKIQPNDILVVTLQTIEQVPTNTPISTSSTGVFNPLNGFLVNKDGEVELSLIGKIKVGGLTTSEARDAVREKAKDFYKNPVVNLRIANFDITVLGEVARPSVYTFPSEKVSILEALGTAGDLTIFGKRNTVLLLRKQSDSMLVARYDLNSSSILQSPYYYLNQRDVIYVEPNKAKITASDTRFTRNLSIISSFISIASLLLVFRNLK